MFRLSPIIAFLILGIPVIIGTIGSFLPAIGIDYAINNYEISIDPFLNLIETPGFWKSSILSLTIGLVTTVISLVLVVLFVACWHETKLFGVILRLLSPILSIPHAAAAFGLAFLIAPSGLFFRFFSPWATGFERPPDLLILNDPFGISLMAGLIGKEVPFLLLLTIATLTQSNTTQFTNISSSLGYGKVVGWLKSTFPVIYQQIRLPVLAVLVYATSVVDVSIILGPTTPPPFALQLLSWINDPDLSLRSKASAGAFFQLLLTLFTIVIWFTLEKIVTIVGKILCVDGIRFKSDQIVRYFNASLMILIIITALLSIFVLIIWSVAGFWQFPNVLPANFTLSNWMRYLPNLIELTYTTLVVGLLATFFCALIVIMCLENEYRTGIRLGIAGKFTLFLPLLVPQISFLFGFQVILLVLGIDNTISSVIFVHMVFTFPYLYLSLANQWHALDPHYMKVSASLGSSQLRTLLKIRIPLLMRPILTACAVGLAVSISQYLPTLLIGGGRISTITTEAVSYASGGNRQIIAIHTIIQMFLPLVGFSLAILIPSMYFQNRKIMKVA